MADIPSTDILFPCDAGLAGRVPAMGDREPDLSLGPLSAPASAAVDEARRQRAIVGGILGPRHRRASARTSTGVDASRSAPSHALRRAEAGPGASLAAAAQDRRPQLQGAVVVPAGALLRGYVRARALLLAGDLVGNVHCTAGPVVIRRGATLQGRLVASGDVYVCGRIGDSGGGAVISTRGRVTLAPGGRVDGDVRSGRLDLYDGAMLNGVARSFED